MKVLFATKCWKGDWEWMIEEGFDRKVAACEYPFTNSLLVFNNGCPDDLIHWKGVHYEDYMHDALEFFDMGAESLGLGFQYSIAELIAVYLADGYDYLCWVQGDVETDPGWVEEGLVIMRTDPTVICVSPRCKGQEDPEGKGHFFSDQAFLIPVAEWRKPGLFNLETPVLHEYPLHGGSSFERRAARYLHTSGKYRYSLKEHYYVHPVTHD